MKRAFILFFFIMTCMNENERDAKWYLENGFYRISSALYEEEVKKNENNCSAHYGLLLSRFLFFLNYIITSSSVSGKWISEFLPQEYGDLDTIVETNLIPMREHMIIPIISSAQSVIERNCSFRTENGIEFTISVIPERKIWIGKEFLRKEAYFVRGVMGFINAFISFISSHDLSMNYGILLETLNSDYIRDKFSYDIIGLIRELGIIMDSSPEFLEWSEERKEMFNYTSPSLIGALEDIASGIEETFLTETGKEDAFFSYIDKNKDGRVNIGDEIRIGILKFYSEDGEPFPFELPIRISDDLFGLFFFSLGEDYIKNLVLFLRNLSKSISNGRILNLSEFNEIVPYRIPIFPDTISINLKKLIPDNYKNAVPLRRMLPLWKTINRKTIFLVEGELGKTAYKSMEIGDGIFCWTCLPGKHFPKELYGLEEIDDDCLSIKPPYFEINKMRIPLIYIYWHDPTFNNSIYVDLSSINNCPPDENYSGKEILGHNYSLNKALNYLLPRFFEFLHQLNSAISN